ncbi:MAG: hypothetical protein ABL903_15210 [Methylococcales bacterium]
MKKCIAGFYLLLMVMFSYDCLALYTVEYIPALSAARGIDDFGNIAGNKVGYNQSTVITSDGSSIVIPCGSFPYATVDGVVVGADYDLQSAVTSSFIWKDGVCSKAGGIYTGYSNGKVAGYTQTSAFYGSTVISYPGSKINRVEGVNRAGIVAGYSQVPTSTRRGAPLKTIGWLWSQDAGFFKTFPGYQIADVNDNGDVLSAAPASVFRNGLEEALPIPPNTFGTWLYEINNFGDIAGQIRTSSSQYLYSGVVLRRAR